MGHLTCRIIAISIILIIGWCSCNTSHQTETLSKGKIKIVAETILPYKLSKSYPLIWVPSADRLVFFVEEAGLYGCNGKGGNIGLLYENTPNYFRSYDLSPDGKKLLVTFTSGTLWYNSDLIMVDLENREEVWLTNFETETETSYSYSGYFSPRGNYIIALVEYREHRLSQLPLGGCWIDKDCFYRIISLPSNKIIRDLRSKKGGLPITSWPAFSPDEKYIIYSMYYTYQTPLDKSEEYQVILEEVATGVQTILFGGFLRPPPHSFAWAPDGKHIIFLADLPEGDQVFIIPHSGTNRLSSADITQLTNLKNGCSSISWSSDSSKIAFIHNREIYVIDKEGTNLTSLIPNNDRAYSQVYFTADNHLAAVYDDKDYARLVIMEISTTSLK